MYRCTEVDSTPLSTNALSRRSVSIVIRLPQPIATERSPRNTAVLNLHFGLEQLDLRVYTRHHRWFIALCIVSAVYVHKRYNMSIHTYYYNIIIMPSQGAPCSIRLAYKYDRSTRYTYIPDGNKGRPCNHIIHVYTLNTNQQLIARSLSNDSTVDCIVYVHIYTYSLEFSICVGTLGTMGFRLFVEVI